MAVSTEILAVLVTIACGVMGVNMIVMKYLWDDLKLAKRDQATLREAVATKADIVHYCEPRHDQAKRDITEQFCRKVDEIKNSLEDLWERTHHHSHDPQTGKVIIS